MPCLTTLNNNKTCNMECIYCPVLALSHMPVNVVRLFNHIKLLQQANIIYITSISPPLLLFPCPLLRLEFKTTLNTNNYTPTVSYHKDLTFTKIWNHIKQQLKNNHSMKGSHLPTASSPHMSLNIARKWNHINQNQKKRGLLHLKSNNCHPV